MWAHPSKSWSQPPRQLKPTLRQHYAELSQCQKTTAQFSMWETLRLASSRARILSFLTLLVGQFLGFWSVHPFRAGPPKLLPYANVEVPSFSGETSILVVLLAT